MFEAALVIVGGLVVVPALFVLVLVVGLLVAAWETWWFLPLWPMVAEPLGLPPINFWHLFALNLFVSVLWMPVPLTDYAKVEDKQERVIAGLMRIAVVLSRPVAAYYVIRWAL